MSYMDRNRDRVSFGLEIDGWLETSRQLGGVRGKIHAALMYLDCGDLERAEAKLREALAEGDAQ
jgi:Tfp pilus assembly protein FimV